MIAAAASAEDRATTDESQVSWLIDPAQRQAGQSASVRVPLALGVLLQLFLFDVQILMVFSFRRVLVVTCKEMKRLYV
jgi:hypothetical protein